MKRAALAFAPFVMLIAGFAVLNTGPASAAEPDPPSGQAAQSGPYASATDPARAPGTSIPYNAGGPAYVPGQRGTRDFQLQH